MSGTAVIAYIILTLSIGYAFIYPDIGELNTLAGEREKYENSLEMVSNIESKKQELLTQLNSMSAEDKKSVETVIPSSFNFVRLISQIDTVASRYAISIDNITSREMSSSVGSSISEGAPAREYNSAVIGFSFTTSYDRFNAFLADLEKSTRILDVKSVKLRTEAGGMYSYDVEFETYWLKSS